VKTVSGFSSASGRRLVFFVIILSFCGVGKKQKQNSQSLAGDAELHHTVTGFMVLFAAACHYHHTPKKGGDNPQKCHSGKNGENDREGGHHGFPLLQ